MKKTTIYSVFLIASFIMMLISCKEDDDVDVEYTEAYPIAGEWFVNEYDLDGNLLYGPYLLYIYNSSFSKDSLWIDNIYDSDIKIKAIKTGETTFAASQSSDINGGVGTVDVNNAAVLNNDSISFEVVLYDSTGVIDNFIEAGHRRTGFE